MAVFMDKAVALIMQPIRVKWRLVLPVVLALFLLFVIFLGATPESRFRLELVQVVVRHGDRYHLHSLPNNVKSNISCRIGEHLGHMAPTMREFEHFMRSEAMRVPTTHKLHGFTLYPHKDQCDTGDLTPEGAAQHVRNGQYLRKIYLDKWKLLHEEDFRDQLVLVSTDKPRTVQSAMALLFGFLQEFELKHIRYERASTSSMCTALSKLACTCPSIARFTDYFAPSFNQDNPSYMGQKQTQQVYKAYAEVLGIPRSELPRKPSEIYDVSMIQMCHNLPLPGPGRHCVHSSSIRQLFELVNKHGHDEVNNPTYSRTVRLKMHPLLYEMAGRMEQVGQGMLDTRFVLYSGHDSSVEPLATALGVSDGTWPRYASKLVVELYSATRATDRKQMFMRVLYDGEDVTGSLSFCRDKVLEGPVDLCPLEHFIHFVRVGNMEELGVKSYREACETM